MATFFFCNYNPSPRQSSQLPKINIQFQREDIAPPTNNTQHWETEIILFYTGSRTAYHDACS